MTDVARGVPPAVAPVDYLARTRERYESIGFTSYRWAVEEPLAALAPVSLPMSEMRVGLIGSGGVYVVGQEAYHFKDDASYRAVPATATAADLRVTHFAYDLKDARRDPEVVFPFGALRSLAQTGHIGSVAETAYSFVGGIYSARKVREQLAPALVALAVAQQWDMALLVPV